MQQISLAGGWRTRCGWLILVTEAGGRGLSLELSACGAWLARSGQLWWFVQHSRYMQWAWTPSFDKSLQKRHIQSTCTTNDGS